MRWSQLRDLGLAPLSPDEAAALGSVLRLNGQLDPATRAELVRLARDSRDAGAMAVLESVDHETTELAH